MKKRNQDTASMTVTHVKAPQNLIFVSLQAFGRIFKQCGEMYLTSFGRRANVALSLIWKKGSLIRAKSLHHLLLIMVRAKSSAGLNMISKCGFYSFEANYMTELSFIRCVVHNYNLAYRTFVLFFYFIDS